MATKPDAAASPNAEAEPASTKVFSFTDLIPEPLEFKDQDGKVYEVKTTALFGAKEMAVFRRVLRRYYAAQRTLETADLSEDAEDEAIAQLEQMVDQVVDQLIIALPPARLKALPFARKAQFIAWWQQEQTPAAPAEVPAGEAPGRPLTPA